MGRPPARRVPGGVAVSPWGDGLDEVRQREDGEARHRGHAGAVGVVAADEDFRNGRSGRRAHHDGRVRPRVGVPLYVMAGAAAGQRRMRPEAGGRAGAVQGSQVGHCIPLVEATVTSGSSVPVPGGGGHRQSAHTQHGGHSAHRGPRARGRRRHALEELLRPPARADAPITPRAHSTGS